MQLPTEKLEINSHRPGIGWLIATYKKIIHLLISPYLRNVFEKEHVILNSRFVEVDERQRQADERQRQADERQKQTLSQIEDICKDLIERMDSIAIILNKRQEELVQQYEDTRNKLETCRYRLEYYIENIRKG